uniref:Small ribosomal subunit protein uS15m n=1 Tax=Periophthalmus magnuspinnatus TaxID=409849 RepID=A0A3B3ZDX9_9GOBI
MFTNMSVRSLLRLSGCIFREANAVSSALSAEPLTCSTALLSGPNLRCGSFALQPQVRHYARAAKKSVAGMFLHLSDLTPTMLKLDYATVPLAQTYKEKLELKKELLISKVQRDKNDRNSEEVRVAMLTARICNFQDHLQIHPKDKANKRRMLMAIDKRKKILKKLRLIRYDAFEKVCEQLGITYTFPPEYYRRVTRRWLAKKAFCLKVFKEVQKQKAEEKNKMKQNKVTKDANIAKAQ